MLLSLDLHHVRDVPVELRDHKSQFDCHRIPFSQILLILL
jgi:hypothetical protein